MIRIVIPHKDIWQKDINTAPYHRWEHLFVNILQKEKEVCNARGMTKCDRTELYVEVEHNCFGVVNKCIKRIRNGNVSEREFIIEGIIVNNELRCMEMVYRKRIGRCENERMLTPKEMYDFRDREYLWDGINVINEEISEILYDNKSESEQPQDRIALIRSRMMQHFRNTVSISSVVNCKGSGFVLYRVECTDGLFTFGQCKEVVRILDMPKGFIWSKLKRRYAESFLFWTSVENSSFKGFQLFTFINVNRILILWDLLTEYVVSLPIWGKLDRNLVNEYFANPLVMICAI